MSYESSSTSLKQGDIERFSRQIILDGIGTNGMDRISQATVLCVGAGGLGSTAALYLAAAGVGKLIICDGDEVELCNLHRQIIHTVDSIELNKAKSAQGACRRINPFTDVSIITDMLTTANAKDVIQCCQVVLDCTDNVASRFLINDTAMKCHVPVIFGSAMRWEGQLSVYGWDDGPCYRCVFPVPPPAEAVGSCNDVGVLGPIPGMIGCLQAMEALKLITGVGSTLSGKMFIFDGFSFSSRVITLRSKQSSCIACGSSSMVGCSDALPEYGMVKCTPGCSALLPSLPSNLRCSPSVLVSLKQENDEMLEDALAEMKSLRGWNICLDVRERNQYEMVRLPGSVSLAYSILEEWNRDGVLGDRWNDFIISTLLYDIMQHSQLEDVTGLLPQQCCIYVICRRGINSVKATQLLKDAIASDSTGIADAGIAWVFKSVDGGLNAYHKKIDPSFPFY